MKLEDIATCAQLACILEVSAPKPGNVNRLHDFADTKFEHFVASGVAIGGPVSRAADRGCRAGNGDINPGDIRIGELIKEAVIGASQWHRGKNTNLGISMLLIPLGACAGMALAKGNDLQENIDPLIKATTYQDSLNLYEAIRHANPGGLGSSEHLDVNDLESDRKIEEEGTNIYQIMDATIGDSIARELVTSYEISFDVGYPAIMEGCSDGNIDTAAVVHAFLTILSKIPDTLIARKNGMDVAQSVSENARAVLDGSMNVAEFDSMLRSKDNRLNPGTTADLVASSLMIALLRGVRP
ncbi:MAG: triphosphoribosyl-dephospho-CoA synthase [Candidatus Hydrothermarchaeaceae archaeon]